jgi:hypothetical protein
MMPPLEFEESKVSEFMQLALNEAENAIKM